MGWVWGKNDMEWVEGARCEDAPCCGCCDINEPAYQEEWNEVDAGHWDDDPSPYGGTYSEC